MSKIIQEIEKQRMTREVPAFRPGDTVVVQVKVVGSSRVDLQACKLEYSIVSPK